MIKNNLSYGRIDSMLSPALSVSIPIPKTLAKRRFSQGFYLTFEKINSNSQFCNTNA